MKKPNSDLFVPSTLTDLALAGLPQHKSKGWSSSTPPHNILRASLLRGAFCFLPTTAILTRAVVVSLTNNEIL